MSQGHRAVPGVINNTQPLETIHTTMASIVPNIENAKEAKSHLFSTGRALPGEEISLETLARTLFSVVANHSKIPAQASNVILAAAYVTNHQKNRNRRQIERLQRHYRAYRLRILCPNYR